MKYDNNRDCNYFEITLLRLLFLIAHVKIGFSGEDFAYMHKLKKELFDYAR